MHAARPHAVAPPSPPDAGGARPSGVPRVGFLYIGGAHQVYHTGPVAAALAREGGCDVRGFCLSDAEAGTFARLARELDAGDLPVEMLRVPDTLALIERGLLRGRSFKNLHLFAMLHRLMRMDAIVTAERTSSWLAALPAGPRLIHIPHGAGDRAKGFEKRMRRFDHVIVAGAKDRSRLIGEGLVAPARCSVSGYVKLDGLRAAPLPASAPLFGNDRPTVLYNPHFEPALSSWERCGDAVIRAFAAQDRYNLVVAPHVRLFAQASAAKRARWLALAVPDRIHIDLGSERCCDMTYTRHADIYLGDVSSQVYEFASTPRPCIFLNPHGFAWRDDPNFACWAFGAVIGDVGALLATLDTLQATSPRYSAIQRSAALNALGDDTPASGLGAAATAAAIVARIARAACRAVPATPGAAA